MNKLTVREHNTETNQIIDREMTAAELEQHELNQAEAKTRKAEAETKALNKSALLAKLGITEDEAKILLG